MPLIRLFLFATMALACCMSSSAQGGDWKLFPGSKPPAADSNENQVVRNQRQQGVEHSVTISMNDTLEAFIQLVDSMDRENFKPQGFRIQIFSASGPESRSKAYDKQSEFLNLYPSVKSYTFWNYPNWVVRIGDFRSRLEALEYHMELREQYPASFIIRDEISIGED